MPIIVFGNSSNNSEHKIDTNLFVQKPYLRTNYIESDKEEDIDFKINMELKNNLILSAYEKQLQKILSILYIQLMLVSMTIN